MVSQALQQVRARRGLGLGHAATLPREDDRLRQRGAGEAPVGGSGDAVWACEREVLEGAGEVERELARVREQVDALNVEGRNLRRHQKEASEAAAMSYQRAVKAERELGQALAQVMTDDLFLM